MRWMLLVGLPDEVMKSRSVHKSVRYDVELYKVQSAGIVDLLKVRLECHSSWTDAVQHSVSRVVPVLPLQYSSCNPCCSYAHVSIDPRVRRNHAYHFLRDYDVFSEHNCEVSKHT